MERIVLFRYHRDPLICQDRLVQLKDLNPEINIYGLYGGDPQDFPRFRKGLSAHLEHNYCVAEKSDEWKWKNGDLAVRKWYKHFGRTLQFDMLHVIEWDLLLFGSLEELYKKVPENGIGLTALTAIENVEDKWDWTSRKSLKKRWLKLLRHVRDHFNYNGRPYASLGPGLCLPKGFLEKFSSLPIPEWGNDELRVPLFGQILGFKLYDTGFCKKWFDEENEKEFFNCTGHEIDIATIKKELKKKRGRKVFHPYRKQVSELVF